MNRISGSAASRDNFVALELFPPLRAKGIWSRPGCLGIFLDRSDRGQRPGTKPQLGIEGRDKATRSPMAAGAPLLHGVWLVGGLLRSAEWLTQSWPTENFAADLLGISPRQPGRDHIPFARSGGNSRGQRSYRGSRRKPEIRFMPASKSCSGSRSGVVPGQPPAQTGRQERKANEKASHDHLPRTITRHSERDVHSLLRGAFYL